MYSNKMIDFYIFFLFCNFTLHIQIMIQMHANFHISGELSAFCNNINACFGLVVHFVQGLCRNPFTHYLSDYVFFHHFPLSIFFFILMISTHLPLTAQSAFQKSIWIIFVTNQINFPLVFIVLRNLDLFLYLIVCIFNFKLLYAILYIFHSIYFYNPFISISLKIIHCS